MYIGIDVGGTNLKAGLVDAEGRMTGVKRVSLGKWESEEKLAQELVTLAKDLMREQNAAPKDIECIGVGFPGMVDNASGNVLFTPNIPLHHAPMRAMMRKLWDIPVYLGNDANCAALGEFYGGAGRGAHSLVVVTLGTGVGAGIVIDGRIFEGFNGAGSEAGHMVIVHGGEKCNCGRSGCWEQYASATALIRMARRAMDGARESALWTLCGGRADKVDGAMVFAAAQQGDETAKAVCGSYVEYLAAGVTNLVDILEPEVIAIGGGISHAPEELLMAPLREIVEREDIARNGAAKRTRIVRAHLGNDAGIIGAAMIGYSENRGVK